MGWFRSYIQLAEPTIVTALILLPIKANSWTPTKVRDLLLHSLEFFSTVHALMRYTATLLRLSSQGFNNTYNQDLFTERALEIIENHDVSQPLYLYLAYMNVHAGCGETLGLQAPLSSVSQYAYTELDTYKVRPLFKRRSA